MMQRQLFGRPTFADFRDSKGNRWCHLYGSREDAEHCARRVVASAARGGDLLDLGIHIEPEVITYELREARA